MVKYVPKVHYDRSIVRQTFLLRNDGLGALAEVCKDRPRLETITLRWTLRDTKTNWKKVYVDINCLDGKKKLVFPAVRDINRRMPRWEATLHKELGPDYVKYNEIIHSRGGGSMQCSYMLGRHTAGLAYNKKPLIVLVK